jgi:Cu/Ag efflux protein CusF
MKKALAVALLLVAFTGVAFAAGHHHHHHHHHHHAA